ncbi:DNA replication initiation control protein YabA [Enterococcus sp. LJL90]
MDKRSLYDGLNELETELSNSLAELIRMKESLLQLVEKNATLEMENQRLRQHLQELDQAKEASAKKTAGLSQSRMNLEKIYEDGFHVCNEFYGSRRENDEPCLLCSGVIYRESTK